MPMKQPMTIGVDALERLYDQYNRSGQFTHHGKCHHCGCLVDIVIRKTSGGYGLLGGILLEPAADDLLALCVDCYEKEKRLD